jgi:hypothetical protein
MLRRWRDFKKISLPTSFGFGIFFLILVVPQYRLVAGVIPDADVSLTVISGGKSVVGVTGIPPSADMIKVEVGQDIQIQWSSTVQWIPNYGYDASLNYAEIYPNAGSCTRVPNGTFQNWFWVLGGAVSAGYAQYEDRAQYGSGNVYVTTASLPPGYYSFGIYCTYWNPPAGVKQKTEIKTVTIAVSPAGTDGCVPTNTCWKSICSPQTCTECGQRYNGQHPCAGGVPNPVITNSCACRVACLPGEIVSSSNSCTTPGINQRCCPNGSSSSSSGSVTPPANPLITSFTTNQATLSSPGTVRLSWQTTSEAVSCTASGAWSGPITPGSGVMDVNVSNSGTYYLDCINASGISSGEKFVTVTINGSCTPNTSCAADRCTFETCSDGCGGFIGGTKSCDGQLCVPNNSCILTTPVGSSCRNNCGQQVPGSMRSGGSTPATPSLPPSSSAPPTAANTSSISSIPVITSPVLFQNPLKFNNPHDLLTTLLTFFQGIIVILSLIMIIIGAFLYITSAGDEGRMSQGKKAILAALIGLALGIAAPAFLREIASILGWGTPNLPSGVGTSLTLIQIATNVLNFLLTIIGILAIIMLVIGGIMYLTAAGNEDTLDKGKRIVKYSLIGITIALASLVLVKAVAGLLS